MCTSRRSRWRTGYWALAGGEEADTFLHRQLSASHIWNSRAKVRKERFILSSGTFQHLTLTHTTHKTLFPYFLPSGDRGEKKILNHVQKVFKLSIPKYCLTQLLCWVIQQSRFFTTSSHLLHRANQARSRLNGSAALWRSFLVGKLGWKVVGGKSLLSTFAAVDFSYIWLFFPPFGSCWVSCSHWKCSTPFSFHFFERSVSVIH